MGCFYYLLIGKEIQHRR